MAKVKYYYNPETCQYERVKVKTTDIIFNILGFLTAAAIMGLGFTVVFSKYYKTDQEQKLYSENQELKFHYKLLNKRLDEANETLTALQERDDNIYRVIFGVDPIPLNARSAGMGGTEHYQDLLDKGLKQEELIIETFKDIDQVKRKMYIQSKSYDQIVQLVKDKSKMLASTPAIQPISNKQLTRLTSGFGIRIHPIYKVGQFHPGIDFAAPQGTPIYATADGEVTKVTYDGGYGNHVEIDHGYGYKTLYAHMYKHNTKPGQLVKRGECIGYVGSTGLSTAPHVHYEVIYKGEQVNPVYFFFKDLSDEEYEKILELASIENQSL